MLLHFTATISPDGRGLFQARKCVLPHCIKYGSGMVWGTWRRHWHGLQIPQILTCSIHGAETSSIHGGPTLQHTGLKGSAANVLVLDTTITPCGSSFATQFGMSQFCIHVSGLKAIFYFIFLRFCDIMTQTIKLSFYLDSLRVVKMIGVFVVCIIAVLHHI